MRAAIADHHSGHSVAVTPDWPDPQPDEGWVTVLVRRAALNRLDALHLTGRENFSAPAVLGSDAAGIVHRVRPWGCCRCSEAGGHRVCHRRGVERRSFAIQIAAALGARVVAVTSSEQKAKQAVSLGAHETVSRTLPDFAAELQRKAGGADLVLEPQVPMGQPCSRRCVPARRMVVLGRNVSPTGEVPVNVVFWRHLEILDSFMRTPRDFRMLLGHLEQSTWTPVIDSVYSLDEIDAAYRRLDDPDRFGKVILDPTR